MKKTYLVFILVFALALALMLSVNAKAASGPVITKQPEDATVSYPDGASFTVEVEKPEEVASYKWTVVDSQGTEFELEGASAGTDTLVVPSTMWFGTALDFYCTITDKDGNTAVSDYATLDADNRDIVKPVFYVGEFAVEPGETLDLAKVDLGDGRSLGSGTVSFDENATDITISNLYFDNSHTLAGLATAPNVGLDLEFYMPDKDEYNVTFVGDNRIVNTYYDYDYNAGGIPFDFYFNGDGPKPLVNFIGDGTLSITNGTYAIRVLGDLMVDVDVKLEQTVDLYADGIVANNIMIGKDADLDLDVYGSALKALAGNIFIDGADIKVTAHAPHISMGIAVPRIFYAKGDIMIVDAKIDVAADVDPAICEHIAGYAGFEAMGDFFSYDSEISYRASAKEKDTIYASDFLGIAATSGIVEDSDIAITIDSPYIYGASGVFGVYMEEDFSLLRSDFSVDIRVSGSAYGAAPERDFNAEDSSVSVTIIPYPNFDRMDAYGIMCENFAVKITDPAVKVSSFAKNGISVGCNLGLEPVEDPAKYEEGYEAKNVYLRDGTECFVPDDWTLGLGNVVVHDEIGDLYLYVETYYDKEDTSRPAEGVVFGYEPLDRFTDVPKDAYYADAVAWAVMNDVTNGTSNTTFSPEKLCTRAEIVTFLWRAAGSPDPKSETNPFTDVPSDRFYTQAVLWAVENGITKGTSDTAFSPDRTCTRAEIVTFLWRAAGSPKPESVTNPFTDVKAGAYYTDAILWAVENDITKGTSATTFSPDKSCKRADAVTFLYRAQSVRGEDVAFDWRDAALGNVEEDTGRYLYR